MVERFRRFRRFRQDVRAVVERDPAARAGWEVALLYPGLHAVWAHRVSHWLWHRRRYTSARALSQAARWATGIEIHPGARLGEGVFIDHGSGVVIGETAEVGDGVTIYHGVTLGGSSLEHGKRHPTIGARVTIGAGAKILGNLTVGDDSKIGANAVLVRSVEENSVVVGVPGQAISRARKHTAADRPDLDHVDIPDPVGVTVRSLLQRVEALEARLAETAGATGSTGTSEISATTARQGTGASPIAPVERLDVREVRMVDVGVWREDDFSI